MHQANCECLKHQGMIFILSSKDGFFFERRDSRKNSFVCFRKVPLYSPN